MNLKIKIQKTLVEGKNRLIVVALDGSELIGSGIVDYYIETPLLYNLYIDEDYRKRGIASKMIARVADWCKSDGKINLCLNVTSGNERAETLYKKHGFKTIYDYPDSEEYMMALTFNKD